MRYVQQILSQFSHTSKNFYVRFVTLFIQVYVKFIIGYVAKTIIAALDWKMGIQDAITLPHFLNRNGTTDLEKGSKLEGLKANLEKLGHTVRVRKLTSGLHGITISKNGILFGGADPRREGVAIGD